jgi:hypothetical protein
MVPVIVPVPAVWANIAMALNARSAIKVKISRKYDLRGPDGSTSFSLTVTLLNNSIRTELFMRSLTGSTRHRGRREQLSRYALGTLTALIKTCLKS